MDLKEERNMILDMVSEGKITVEEAKKLLDALDEAKPERKTQDEHFHWDYDFPRHNIHIPNIPHIVNRANRMRFSRHVGLDAMEEAKEALQDEMEKLQEQIEQLKEELSEHPSFDKDEDDEEDW